jgi:peptidyl-prolyl cis-trans isomerase B (cyclophilin B)
MRVAILLAAGLLLVGCGGTDNESSAGASSTTDSGGGKSTMDCDIGGDASKAELADLDESKTHSIVVDTNKGSFTFELATNISPCTTAAFAGLVEKGFFDGLTFHRIVPGFVIQGGDPLGNGMGGPGYTTVDAPPQDTKYEKGLVAMAKAGNEPAGTSGSQFFVVSADGVQLPADYAVLGRVTDGIDVVEKIGELGNPNDPNGAPTEKVDIEKMELQTS